MAQAKDTQVTRLLSQNDVVYLQKVRGEHDVVARAMRHYAATHTGWISCRGDGTAGGVAILVSRTMAAHADAIAAVELIPGRILRVTLTRGTTDRLDLANIHKEGLSRFDRAAVLADFRDTERLRSQTRATHTLK